MRKGCDREKQEKKNGGEKTGKKEEKKKRLMIIVATTSLPAVDRPLVPIYVPTKSEHHTTHTRDILSIVRTSHETSLCDNTGNG